MSSSTSDCFTAFQRAKQRKRALHSSSSCVKLVVLQESTILRVFWPVLRASTSLAKITSVNWTAKTSARVLMRVSPRHNFPSVFVLFMWFAARKPHGTVHCTSARTKGTHNHTRSPDAPQRHEPLLQPMQIWNFPLKAATKPGNHQHGDCKVFLSCHCWALLT